MNHKNTHSLYKSSKIIIAIGLFIIHTQSQSMIVGATCLKRYVGNNKQNKLVILYDRHAVNHHEIKQGHVADVCNLIKIASKNEKPVPYLLEISDIHKDPNALKTMLPCPISTAIAIALTHNMKYGNVNFISFDDRKKCDSLMQAMMLQTDQFVQAMQQGRQLMPDFYTINAENILHLINNRKNTNIKIIDSLPTSQYTKTKYNNINKQKHEKCYATISQLCKAYGIDNDLHLINLVTQLNRAEKNELFAALIEESSFAVDMNLLQKSLIASEQYPLSIVHGGCYHSNNTEQRIMSDFSGFEKDELSSMVLPDLKLELDSLATFEYPKHVPENFMNSNMKQFISINNCRE